MLRRDMKLKRAHSVQCKIPATVETRHRKYSSRRYFSSQYDLPYHCSPYWIPTPFAMDQPCPYPASTCDLDTGQSVRLSSSLTACSANGCSPSNGYILAGTSSQVRGSEESLKNDTNLKDTLSSAKQKTAEISIPGVKNVIEDKAHTARKVVWLAVLLVCACIAFIQVHDRVVYYLSTPVTVTLRIARNESLKYPVVTICNRYYLNVTALNVLKASHPDNAKGNSTHADRRNYSDFITNSSDTKQLWEFVNLDIQKQMTECWFGRNITCQKAGQWRKVHTYEGVCDSFIPNKEYVTSTGLFNNLYLKLKKPTADMDPKHEDGWRFLVHDRIDVPMLTVRTHGTSVLAGTNKDVRLYVRSFKTLSTNSRPCNSDPDYSETRCYAKCFAEAVVKNSTCHLPYMVLEDTKTLKPGLCSTPEEYRRTSKVASDALFYGKWTSSHCNCSRQCNEDLFVPHMETTPSSGSSRLRVYFQDWTFDEVEEEHAYSFIALLCDFGGSLGLFLGASVLTFFEILEVIFAVMAGLFRKCRARCCS